jgi:SatD family (SatD)
MAILGWDIAMASNLYAVLIADVVASSSRQSLRQLLGKTLSVASGCHLRGKLIQLPYSVTAGDEFQTVIANLPALPQIILDLRIMLQPLSLRIGVGFGRIADRIEPPVNRLGGEAFQLARQAIQAVKTGRQFKFESLTVFASRQSAFDETINLIYGLHDTLVAGITEKQWETIAAFTSNPTLASTSRRLKLDASTISRNLKRGYYWQLTATAKAVESFIGRTFC